MCARFSLAVNPRLFRAVFGVEPTEWDLRPELAPTDQVPVVGETNGQRWSETMRWGLIPTWAKDERVGINAFNARCETIAEKPTFRAAYEERRCLIPASSWYEWIGKSKYALWPAGTEVFAFAGLWEEWRGIKSCTIITCEPTPDFEKYQTRMPVILSPSDYQEWLSEGTLQLLHGWAAGLEAELTAGSQMGFDF